LNSVSRTRSGVGRSPASARNSTQRPRHSPPMMRTRPALALSAFAGRRIGFGPGAGGSAGYRIIAAPRRAQGLVIDEVFQADSASIRGRATACGRGASDGNDTEPAELVRAATGRAGQDPAFADRGARDTFSRRKTLDEDLFEQLETRLLLADVGVATTREILDALTGVCAARNSMTRRRSMQP
jgi:hypothetical protein